MLERASVAELPGLRLRLSRWNTEPRYAARSRDDDPVELSQEHQLNFLIDDGVPELHLLASN